MDHRFVVRNNYKSANNDGRQRSVIDITSSNHLSSLFSLYVSFYSYIARCARVLFLKQHTHTYIYVHMCNQECPQQGWEVVVGKFFSIVLTTRYPVNISNRIIYINRFLKFFILFSVPLPPAPFVYHAVGCDFKQYDTQGWELSSIPWPSNDFDLTIISPQ